MRESTKNYKRVFVVDTENTNDFRFIKDFEVDNKDDIVLFLSEKSKPIPPKDFHYITLNNLKLKTEYIQVGTANAMDFQIVSYIALNIGAKVKKKYFIVSNDKGFELATKYIEEKNNVTIEMIYQEELAKKKKEDKIINNPTSTNGLSIREDVLSLIKKELKIETIPEKIQKMSFKNKSLLHNQLVMEFGSKGQDVYKIIKPILK